MTKHVIRSKGIGSSRKQTKLLHECCDPKIAVNEFKVVVPEGSETLNIKKTVIRDLLQRYCNLTIKDYYIESAGEKQSFVIQFE